MSAAPTTVLFVANYASNTGYAWDFIEALYAAMADRLADEGVRSLVAYPAIGAPPRTLEGSVAVPVELAIDLDRREGVARLRDFVRRENVQVLYLTDRAYRSRAFPRLRAAGVRRIICHDHTSGARTAPKGLRRLAKQAVNRVPGILADVIVAVSDYVAERHRTVSLVPSERIVRVHNGVPVADETDTDAPTLRHDLGIAADRPLIACACRAHPVKGVHHLLRAFDLLMSDPPDPRPALVYCGDGPQLEELRALRDDLASADSIFLPGYVPRANPRLADAAVFVVPSVWQDALPLAVMQPMAAGRTVIASRVGGVPEMIEDGVSGYLVEPADEEALSEALRRVLQNPEEARTVGEAARRRVRERFRPEDQIHKLTEIVRQGLAPAPSAGADRVL